MKAGVYSITHTDSGRRYIGSSVRVDARWKAHRRLLRMGRHHSPKLQAAWNEYGEAAFLFEPLLKCEPSKDALLMYETIAFAAFDPVKSGFNVAIKPGSRLGVPQSAEARAKISAAGIGRQPTLGMKLGTGAKISAKLKGRPKPPWTAERREAHATLRRSPEFRARVSLAQKGRPKPQSPEQFARRLEGIRAYWATKKVAR